MPVLYRDNAYSTLANPVAYSDNVITLAAGTGTTFPTIGSPGQYFYLTIYTASSLEVVKVTGQAGTTNDQLTVVRGQGNTTAQAFVAGTAIELRLNAECLNNVAQLDGAAFTASPTVPTPAVSDNSTKAANTAFVTSAVAAAIAAAPQGGPTVSRPAAPVAYQYYFDTDLGFPVFYNSKISKWVNTAGVPA